MPNLKILYHITMPYKRIFCEPVNIKIVIQLFIPKHPEKKKNYAAIFSFNTLQPFFCCKKSVAIKTKNTNLKHTNTGIIAKKMSF